MSDIDSTQESMEDARQEAEHLWIAGLQGEGATEGFAGEHGGCMAGGGAALDCGGQGEGAFEGLAGEHGGFLFYNSLTGTLPTELGELTSLDHMPCHSLAGIGDTGGWRHGEVAARVEVAEEAAAKAVSQAGGSAQSGDAELEALKKLPYVPHVEGNPFPARPATLETDVPQMHDLYNDKTYDTLSTRTNSSMRYEQLVLAPALSCMHDAIAFSEVTLDWCQDEKDPPTVEELSERVYAAHNTFKGVFLLLNNRYTMLQLRASMESDATSHGGAEALRAKLAFIEEKVYAGSDGLVSDSVLTKWLKEFDATKAKAVMNSHAKASAKVSTFRDRRGGKGKGAAGGGAGKGEAGTNSEVMEWISKGAKVRWVDKAPLPFDHGVSLADATPPQLEWMATETARCLKTGA
ncbi:hypothetical protein CYMTET_48800 [Cymbomonas tetramitiformis]|uniref:Uncharacterized protein n=1 Tax=Cymbomonas tetramitiformis TaxID=36881 RepID=A0AAE0EV72_9CHLO|nr:hypothetical protein CYMTET_48800 [Cymbomonas tetramitiformis]